MTSLAMPHRSVLASASYDRTVRLWDARAGIGRGGEDDEDEEGDEDDTVDAGDDERRASPSSASASASASAKTDLPPLATLVGHSDYVTCLASLGASEEGEEEITSSPPRRLASAGLGGEVLLWDLSSLSPASPSPLLRPSALPAARASVFSLASHSTGNLLAVGGPAGALRLVDSRASGRGEGADFRGHSDVVRSLSLSPCGRTLASASSDRTVRLWDVGQRRCVCVLAAHTDSVWAVAPWRGRTRGTGRPRRSSDPPAPAPAPPPPRPPPPPPPPFSSPSSSSSSWGDDLLSAGRDGVVYRTHAPTRAAEAVATMPRSCCSTSPNGKGAPAAAAPAACSALAADFARSLAWVSAAGDPALRAWRVPAARPSAGGSGAGAGSGAAAAAAVAAVSPSPPSTPLSLGGGGGGSGGGGNLSGSLGGGGGNLSGSLGGGGGGGHQPPLLLAVPPAGRAFHVPSSPLVRARQAFGGGGGMAGAAGGELVMAGSGSGSQNPPSPPPLLLPSSFHRQGVMLPPPSARGGGSGAWPSSSSPAPVVEVPGAAAAVVEARWLPDRRRFLTRDSRGKVELWDAASGSEVRTLLPPPPAAEGGKGEGKGEEENDAEARMRKAEKKCWTPAVGVAWAQLDASLGAPRLTLDRATAFSSELYAMADLGRAGAADDLKVNSGVELLRAAAAGWVRELAAAEAEKGEENEEAAGGGETAPAEEKGDDDRAAASALISSLRAAEAEASAAATEGGCNGGGGGDEHQQLAPPPFALASVSAFRELECDSDRLLVISESNDSFGTPLAVPASRIGSASNEKKREEKEGKKTKKTFDTRSLLPRWCLDAVLHGPPAPATSASSSSTSSAAASASASTEMAFALEPHPRSGLPQLAPRRLSAPKVLALAKVAAHARSKLCEPPHSLELGEEPLPCFWDKEKQREAERAEEEGEREEERGGRGGDDDVEIKSRRNLPRLELCIGEFAAPLDLSLAAARDHIWRHVGGGGNGGGSGDMLLWYRAVKENEQRSTRPLLGPE